MLFDGFDVDGDGVLTLKEMVKHATSKMSFCKLSDEKIEAIQETLAKSVPDLQNRETFAKSYAAILGELYISVQLELAVTAHTDDSRSAALQQSASRRFSIGGAPPPLPSPPAPNGIAALFGGGPSKLAGMLKPNAAASRLACMRAPTSSNLYWILSRC